MAISKERKNELVAQYGEWLSQSKAMVLTEYSGLTMKDLDELRKKIREVGGEFHIVKNTLTKLAFDNAGIPYSSDLLEGSTAIGFAFKDAPALAKAMTDFAKSKDFVKIKCGYLDKQLVSADGIKSLADLPPLPVMRGHLLGTIMASANKLARTLAEPGRQVAAVIKAYTESESASATT